MQAWGGSDPWEYEYEYEAKTTTISSAPLVNGNSQVEVLEGTSIWCGRRGDNIVESQNRIIYKINIGDLPVPENILKIF